MGQREECKDDARRENVGSHGMESWGWDLCAASFDVQSIREPAEPLKGPENLAAFATRGALSKSKSHRVLPMRAPRRERQARMTRKGRAARRDKAAGLCGGS